MTEAVDLSQINENTNIVVQVVLPENVRFRNSIGLSVRVVVLVEKKE
jgi:YbbR domain-containing protein